MRAYTLKCNGSKNTLSLANALNIILNLYIKIPGGVLNFFIRITYLSLSVWAYLIHDLANNKIGNEFQFILNAIISLIGGYLFETVAAPEYKLT